VVKVVGVREQVDALLLSIDRHWLFDIAFSFEKGTEYGFETF